MAVTRTRASRRRGRDESSTRVRVSRVERGDLWVRVSTIGTTGERPFVLVPGIGVSSDYFERLAPNLNSFGPVHALDLPGFAGVTHPRTALTIRQFADLVGAAIDDLGLTDPVVVGHSMGTQIVTDLAARRPELSTLVLIGPVVNPAERRVTVAARRFLQAAWHEPGRVKVLAAAGLPRLRRALVLAGAAEDDDLPDRGAAAEGAGRTRSSSAASTTPSRRAAGSSRSGGSCRRRGSGRCRAPPTPSCTPTPRRSPGSASSTPSSPRGPARAASCSTTRTPATATERGEFDFTPQEAAAGDAGRRVREGVAIARGDDAAIGEAKSEHAEAMRVRVRADAPRRRGRRGSTPTTSRRRRRRHRPLTGPTAGRGGPTRAPRPSPSGRSARR